ncbi:hypothetical protein EMCRGX_G027987 [Ephydatia muelleri]
MAKGGRVEDALSGLLALEKQTRLASDALSTARVMKAIVQLCFDLQQWELLNEHILLLTKKRSQLKTAIAAMVEECCKFVDQTPDHETKLKLIDTLRAVSEGKIYVEVPRARLTLELAHIKERDGDIKKAADILQELQVETFGSMEKNDKVHFILEQMRLCLANKDYIRTQIISRKVNTKFFQEESDVVQDLKLKYYHLMIELCLHEGNYIAVSQHYRAVFDTPKVRKDPLLWKIALKSAVLFVLLARYNNDQSDLMHRIYEEKQLQHIPLYRELLDCFRTQELLYWDAFCSKYTVILRSGVQDEPPIEILATGTKLGDTLFDELKKRVIEHNIRVIALYYTRISMQRLADLLVLSAEDTEEFVSSLVANKTVYARIDRPKGIVLFTPSQDPSQVLNEWSSHLNTLMSLVAKTTHLINKEEMVHTLVK